MSKTRWRVQLLLGTRLIRSGVGSWTSKSKFRDQTVQLSHFHSQRQYPEKLRRIRCHDREGHQKLVLLANNFSLPALSVAELYRMRWQIDLFFRWLKQHFRIKSSYGVSPNAVKTQLWIAISVYVLVAILKKKLGIERDPSTILQAHAFDMADIRNQLQLFIL